MDKIRIKYINAYLQYELFLVGQPIVTWFPHSTYYKSFDSFLRENYALWKSIQQELALIYYISLHKNKK